MLFLFTLTYYVISFYYIILIIYILVITEERIDKDENYYTWDKSI